MILRALLLAAAVQAAPVPGLPGCAQSYSDAAHARLSGARALAVSVVDEGGKPAEADVTVSLADGPGALRRWRCTVDAKGGTASFQNLPDADLVVSAADASGRKAPISAAPLKTSSVALTLARPSGTGFLYDRAKGRCLGADGSEGRNAGRVGECGEISCCAAFDAPRDSLSGSAWSNLNLSRRDFTSARLEGLIAKGTRFEGARFSQASAAGAVFEGGSLAGAKLRGADLRGAKIAATLERADLTDADLRGADLAGSELSQAQLTRARYDEATKLPFSVGRAYRRGMVFSGAKPPVVDEGESDPSFRAFRGVLKAAVDKKDAGAVALRLTKTLRARCGSGGAFSCFGALSQALAGGGVFTDDSYSGFLAPAAALAEQRAGDVLFSKQGQQWMIVEIGAAD